jgi:hypothetical protein
MKSLRNLAAFLALFSLTGLSPAFAGTKSVVLVNSTSYTIYAFYASSSDASAWDTTDNLLGTQSIAPGAQVTVNIPDTSSECSYDLMAILYGTEQYAYDYSVNACDSNATWTIANPS